MSYHASTILSRTMARRLFLSSRGIILPRSRPSATSLAAIQPMHCIQSLNNNAAAARHFFGAFSNFDPLKQSSAKVLKQPNEELSHGELTLKQALLRYQQHPSSGDGDDYYLSLEELQQAYMDLGYWKEALGVEETKCADMEKGTDDYADSLHAQGKLYLRQQDFQNSKALYEQALTYFTETDNHAQKGHVLISLAGWYYFQNQLDKAMERLEGAEPLLDTNPALLVKCLDNQGLVKRLWGDYHSALDKYQQALQVVVDEETRQALLMHVGDMYLALEEPQHAMELYQELVKTSTDKGIQGVLWHNIATIHVDQGDYDLALDEFHQALQLKQETGGENHPEVAKTLNSLGVLHAGALHQYPKARESFQKALMIARINAEDASTDSDVINILQNISHIDHQLNK
jgi:tetratricopeptide (TPR) repeat protein